MVCSSIDHYRRVEQADLSGIMCFGQQDLLVPARALPKGAERKLGVVSVADVQKYRREREAIARLL
jgi:hypothetical protein